MFDASAKFIPAGWFDGCAYNLGNFDECVDVEVFVDDDYIQGQYCLVEIEINPIAHSKFRSRKHVFNESSWDTLQASQDLLFSFFEGIEARIVFHNKTQYCLTFINPVIPLKTEMLFF